MTSTKSAGGTTTVAWNHVYANKMDHKMVISGYSYNSKQVSRHRSQSERKHRARDWDYYPGGHSNVKGVSGSSKNSRN